jgi:hypothetical protein
MACSLGYNVEKMPFRVNSKYVLLMTHTQKKTYTDRRASVVLKPFAEGAEEKTPT